MFELVKPTMEYKEKAIEFINEFYEYNSEINGVGGLYRYLDDYEGWLEKLEKDKKQPVTEERVPTETYFLVRKEDDRIIGMINIRLALNEEFKKLNGNIGYCIRPTERGKGYNNINLYLGLKKCKEHGIKDILLTVGKDNEPSKRTILRFNPKFEKEFFEEDKYKTIIQLYWINVEDGIKLWEKSQEEEGR